MRARSLALAFVLVPWIGCPFFGCGSGTTGSGGDTGGASTGGEDDRSITFRRGGEDEDDEPFWVPPDDRVPDETGDDDPRDEDPVGDTTPRGDTGGDTGDTAETGDEPSWTHPVSCPDWHQVPAPDGTWHCGVPCDPDACPDGQRCVSVSSPTGEVAELCVYGHPTSCQPCINDGDCNLVTSITGHKCEDFGNAGSFCVTRCGDGFTACPTDTLCAPGYDGNGQPASYCVPIDGTCACNGLGTALAATTVCKAESDAGTCIGTRSCEATGLTSCSAQAPIDEVCNDVDDDCDGDTDEGVQSPCGGCGELCAWEVEPGSGSVIDASGDPGDSSTLEGGEVLDHPFIWIANSAEATVSRLDTNTGCEVARYWVCSDPSRTAVDFEGSGIIACRGDGGVAKIAVLEDNCVDKNGNGVIDTVKDLDGSCTITTNEMVQGDECILWTVYPEGPQNGCSSGAGCARAAGVDADGHIWIGMWNSKKLWRLDGETGANLVQLPLTVRPYGLAIDPEQTIWVASRDPSSLTRVDPDIGQTGSWGAPMGHAYGLAIDPYGAIWMAGGEAHGVSRFDPFNQGWLDFPESGLGNSRGVAVRVRYDPAGAVVGATVYVAHHAWNLGCSNSGQHRKVSAIDAKTLTALTPVDLGADYAPVGVAIDNAGQLWTVNQCDSSATKVDTDTHQVIGTYPVGLQPYTYSDMTGYALKTITAIQVEFTHTFEGWPAGSTRWQTITADVETPDFTSYVEVSYRIALTKADLPNTAWLGPFGPYPPQQFPLWVDLIAPYLQVKVTGFAESLAKLPTLNKVKVTAALE